MIMDIAFLKSFDVKSEAPHAALENWAGAASDDDDDDEVAMDMDTSSWVVLTDQDTVPLKDIKLHARGKIQVHLVAVYAAAIVGIPDQRPPEVLSFIDQMQQHMQELALEYGTNDPQAEGIITSPFTEMEEEMYSQWVDIYDRHESHDCVTTSPTASPTCKSILACRQSTLNKGCAGAAARAKRAAAGRSGRNSYQPPVGTHRPL